MTLERRRHCRVDAINLLNFSCFDAADRMVEQGMGRTLNVSESGILLETAVPMDLDAVVYVTVAFDDELVDVKGRVVRCKESADKSFEMGITFIDIDEKRLHFIKEYIKMFLATCKEPD